MIDYSRASDAASPTGTAAPLSRRPINLRLARQIPESFARAYNVIPLARRGDTMVVAMANPGDRDALAGLRRWASCEIQPVLCGETEIQVALDRIFDGDPSGSARSAALRVLRDTGFLTPQQMATLEDDLAAAPSVEARDFPLGGTVSEEDYIEALGLALYLPHLRLSRWQVVPAFVRLLPRQMAERWRLVALFPTGHQLVVASPSPPPESAFEEIRNLTGFEPRLVLCAPSEADKALQECYASLPGKSGLPSGGSLERELVERGMVDESQLARARLIARHTGEEVQDILLRLGEITPYDLLEARAYLLDIQPVRLSRSTIDRSLAAIVPETLARRYRCLPVRQVGRSVQVAVTEPADEDTSRVLEVLLGQPVQMVLCSDEELELSMRTTYGSSSTRIESQPVQLGRLLLQSGRLSMEQINRGIQRQHQTGERLGKCLADLGLLDEPGLAELLALHLTLPWVRASNFGPPAETVDLLPEDLARQHGLLPLYHESRLLTVATADPLKQEALDAAAKQTGMGLRVAVAAATAIRTSLEQLYGVDLANISTELQEFGETMVVSGLLSREQLLQAWRHQLRSAVPFDVAVTTLGFLAEPQLADALAAHLKIPRGDLQYRSVPTVVVDALGNRREGVRWTEPLDQEVARLLREETATRLNAIPMRHAGNSITVAFVNPLEGAALREVQEELGRPISPCVATRGELAEALRRAYGRRTLGDLLVERDVLSRHHLAEGLELHRRTGVPLGEALLSLGHITQEQMVSILAEQQDLPYFSLSDVEILGETARSVPETLARKHRVLPLAQDGDSLILAMANPMDREAIGEVEKITGCRVRPVVTTDGDLEAALERIYRGDYLWKSTNDLVYRYPDDSAMRVVTFPQKVVLWAVVGVSALLIYLNPVAYFTALITLSTLFYMSFSTYKFYLIYKAISHTLEVDVTAEDVAALDDRNLPVYTVLVPLYREAEVVPTLIRGMGNMDYPKAKLDVKLLLEEDDTETIEEIQQHELPAHFKVLVVPHALPKGKPKACNYGLLHAEGEYVVIYDAEDIPDRDQLKKVVATFQKADSRVGCIQAKLNYYNRDQNLLTRWFTTEYSMWFDLFIPGLDASNSPIPLGGTSNHFRTSQLRELGGWDPYNVTEDADLGIRLFKAGWRTAVVDSTTYEEANSELYNWIRQRSRWVKGYVQTWLVHMRHPIRLMREVGPYQFFSFNMVIGGTFFGFLVNPVFWGMTALWYLTHWDVIQLLFPAPVFYMGTIGLYFGNFAFMYTNVAGCMRRGYYDMVKYALISPLYWALMSIGAWKGFLQLFYRASYWEKTKHGLYRGEIKTQPSSSLADLI